MKEGFSSDFLFFFQDNTKFRAINFELPPYAFVPPECIEVDGPAKNRAHYVGLWKLPLQQHTDCSKTYSFTVDGIKMFSCTNWGA